MESKPKWMISIVFAIIVLMKEIAVFPTVVKITFHLLGMLYDYF